MDNVAPCVQVGVQECAASGEHLCVGAVHVPGMHVWDVHVCIKCCSAG